MYLLNFSSIGSISDIKSNISVCSSFLIGFSFSYSTYRTCNLLNLIITYTIIQDGTEYHEKSPVLPSCLSVETLNTHRSVHLNRGDFNQTWSFLPKVWFFSLPIFLFESNYVILPQEQRGQVRNTPF